MDELKENAPTFYEHTIIFNKEKHDPLFIKEAFFPCVCDDEGFYVMNSVETHDNNRRYFQEFTFLRYFLTSTKKMSLIERLKYIYQVLKTGKRFGDEIILSAENANKLGKFLIEQTHSSAISELLKSENIIKNS